MNPTPDRETTDVRRGPRLRLDENGHAIPFTAAEREARSEALRLALEAMAAIPDDPNEPDEEFWRAMDESRPDRPLFRELYEP
jgi:hypothetical protein